MLKQNDNGKNSKRVFKFDNFFFALLEKVNKFPYFVAHNEFLVFAKF